MLCIVCVFVWCVICLQLCPDIEYMKRVTQWSSAPVFVACSGVVVVYFADQQNFLKVAGACVRVFVAAQNEQIDSQMEQQETLAARIAAQMEDVHINSDTQTNTNISECNRLTHT